jgi:hypothetical protein
MRAVALVLPFLLLTPGTAHAWRCPKTPTGPPLTAARIEAHGVTAVRVCDRRTGRRATLARGREAAGVQIRDVAFAGRRVAWTIWRRTGRRATITLHEVVGRREVERRTIFRGRAGRLPWGGVAVSARGDLAWEASVVEFQRAGTKVVTRAGRDGESLAFEDRGATLRWLAGAGGDVVYTDLRPPRQRDGCPRRERFATLAGNEQVLVTRAAYGGVEQHTAIRLCLRGEGTDPVVAQAVVYDSEGDSLSVAGLDRTWLVLIRVHGARSLSGFEVSAIDARNGRTSRTLRVDGPSRQAIPDTRTSPAVVTESSVPVWVAAELGQERVIAVTPDGTAAALDAGPGGTIANLRSDGTRVTWTNAGEPKSAEPL